MTTENRIEQCAALHPPYPPVLHCRAHWGDLGYAAQALPQQCRISAAVPQPNGVNGVRQQRTQDCKPQRLPQGCVCSRIDKTTE